MRARPGLNGNAAAVLINGYTYIYGVTTGGKKSRGMTLPGSENADFFQVHALMHTIRVAYIYGVDTRGTCKYAVQKRPGRIGKCTGPSSLTSAGDPILKICKYLSEATGPAIMEASFTYR